jgi:DNA mismatch repair protein MutL
MSNTGQTITALDTETVRQIAAGEVVERPASVVKELVENSLDADATRISVAVEAGGTAGIRVRDDGFGMSEDAVQRAIKEHTTSKINDIDDLTSGVGTLGFRGEALYTISAVSKMTIRTKPRDGNRGTELRVEGGSVVDVESAGCPEGTVVEVSELFFNTPARRKFLKTTATEFDHINTVVTHYALANPDVAITLEHNDREVFATTGRGSLESAVLSVYGREVAESMMSIEARDIDNGNIKAVEGLISHPETTRSTRQYLSTFINGRYVEARVLREAIIDAYGEQLAADRYPFAVLFLDIDPGSIDINVHPRKMEVRFDTETAVRDAVTGSIREALLSAGLIRSRAPRGQSAPAETTITQSSPDVTTENTESDTHVDNNETTERSVQQSTKESESTDHINSNPQSEITGDETDIPESDIGDGNHQNSASIHSPAETVEGADHTETETARHVDPTSDAAWAVDDNHRGTNTNLNSSADQQTPHSSETIEAEAPSETADATSQDQSTPSEDVEKSHVSTDEGDNTADPSDDDTQMQSQRENSHNGINKQSLQHDLTGDVATFEPTVESLPSLRILGQIDATYIIAESDDGLVLIDQHAADERINYEQLQTTLAETVTTQTLAEPVTIELTAGESAQVEGYADALESVGFRVMGTNEQSITVTAVPAAFASTLDPTRVRDVLAETTDSFDSHDGSETIKTLTDEILADLACYPSLTGNTALTEGSAVDLLEQLDTCENPYACPHGRPILIELDRDELDARFERDYPGHQSRRLE